MNLQDLTGGTKDNKNWLTIVSKSLTAQVVTADSFVGPITSDSLTIDEVKGVPNPPVGKITLFSDMSGILNGTNSLGDTTTYINTPQGSVSASGDIPMYADASGSSLTDSGLSSAVLAEVFVGTSGIPSLTEPLAPPGLKDLWKVPPGLTFSGGLLAYDSKDDILYAADWTGANLTQYSTDGGITWAATTYDVSPANSVFIATNNMGLWVALPNYTGGNSYTSTDGKAFVQGPPFPGTEVGTNVIWNDILGLFVASSGVDATHWIITSPDGITWTPRLTPDFTGLVNYTQLIQATNGFMVLVGDSQTQPAWSSDGITWTSGVGSLEPCSAIGYQASLGFFFAIGWVTGTSCYSTDGKVWQDLGTVGPTGGPVSVIWVDTYSRWYASRSNIPSNNFSLFSSIDVHVPMIDGNLDGAYYTGGQDYSSVVYLPNYDRFLLGLDTVGVGYSTSRPMTIKSTSDSILVRGKPVSTGNYSTYADLTCNNTTVETDISTTNQALGNLILQANQNVGTVIRFTLNLGLTSVAGDNVTINYKTQDGLLYSHVIAVPAFSVSAPANIVSTITVRNGNVGIMSIRTMEEDVDMVQLTGVAYDRTAQNTFSITAQWGANVNQLTNMQLIMETIFLGS